MPNPNSKYGTNERLKQMLCAVLAALPHIDDSFDEHEDEEAYRHIFAQLDFTHEPFTTQDLMNWWNAHKNEYYEQRREAKRHRIQKQLLRSAYDKMMTHLSLAERDALGKQWDDIVNRVLDNPPT